MNQFDDLVDEIAKRVMSSLKEKNVNDSNTLKQTNTIQLKSYAMIGENTIVEEYYKKQNFKSTNEYSDALVDVLVISEVNLYSIPRLANLLSVTKEEEAILNHILNNKKVILLAEAVQGIEKTENKPFKTLFQKHLNEVSKMGIEIVHLSHFNEEPKKADVQSQKSIKKKLITLKSVQELELDRGEVFVIEPNAIITALAKDYLNDLSIVVERRGML